MPEENKSIASNFSNLPLESLIAAPLIAASESNILLANATYEFIRNIWIVPEDASKSSEFKAKTLKFNVDVPAAEGETKPNSLTVQAPMAALLEAPNLMIRSIDVNFSMEVKDVVSKKTDASAKTDLTLTADGAWWSAQLTGSLSGSSSHSRNTDRSAKYEVNVRAEQSAPTEGMSRLAQIFASAVDSKQNK
jgi:hypothetical protein